MITDTNVDVALKQAAEKVLITDHPLVMKDVDNMRSKHDLDDEDAAVEVPTENANGNGL